MGKANPQSGKNTKQTNGGSMITEYVTKITDKWNSLNKKGKILVAAVAVIVIVAIVKAV